MQDCGDNVAFSLQSPQPLESQEMEPLRQVEVEEIKDADNPCNKAHFTEAYLGVVGETLGNGETQFER